MQTARPETLPSLTPSPAAENSPASSRGSLAAWLPLEMGSSRVRFHVSETHLLWRRRNGAATVMSWGEIDFVRLDARLSWGPAALWYAALLVLVYAHGSFLAATMTSALVTVGSVANLFLRRRYVLTIAPRAGRRVKLFLGAGFAPGALRHARSSWVAVLLEGYAWLRQDADRHGIAAA